jgi:hypothetical protein
MELVDGFPVGRSALSFTDDFACAPARGRATLLTPTPRAGLDRDEYLALLGALGVLVGLALATSPENTA